MFVLKIRLKRRVFKIFKPGKKFLRSVFFVGSGTRRDGNFKNEDAHVFCPVFPKSLVSRCGETTSQVLQGRLSYGRGSSEDKFEGHESGAFSGAGSAGGGEDTFDDFVHTFENSLVAGDAANALGDMDVAVSAARRGENNCDDHLLEFKNSLLAASAESGYALNCFNSQFSEFAHLSSIHACAFSCTCG